MRSDYDDEIVKAITEITGLREEEDRDVLESVLGAVYATAFLGFFPGKEDLSHYIGASTSEINRLLRAAVVMAERDRSPFRDWMGKEMPSPHLSIPEYIYALTTEMIATGLFLGGGEETYERLVARTLLEAFCPSQYVKAGSLFVGYCIVLEYLWQAIQGSDDDIDHFCEVRYRYMPKVGVKVTEFCELVAGLNTHIFKESDGRKKVCKYLAEQARKAYKKAVENGSAPRGKARVEVAIKVDQNETSRMSRTSRMMAAMIK
ncbi:hypothetical protein IJ098_01775 [Candidatus Saccharibacteria bacterium]|nr:hypothetical protein [Candidatus Saccharibacteria bacterium]